MPKCKICREPFVRRSITHKVCSSDCAVIFTEQEKAKNLLKKAKVERKKDQAKKIALKTRSDWVKDAQVAFNQWIRVRDANEPCISCKRFHSGQYHAGHYLSVGAHPELRFEPLNVWKQCQPCNTHLSGNLINYRKNLIEKIGLEKVEWLEGHHPIEKLTTEDLKEIIKKYKEKKNEILKSRKD